MINMLLLLCGTVNFPSFKPLSKTLLDTHHQTISYLFYDRVQLNQDGSFILAGEWSVWHFDSTGKLIRNFGRKGQGPYEFQYVQKAMWDGTYYWVIDGKTLSIKQFDEAGKFVRSNPKWYLQFLRVNGTYYVEHGIYKKQKKNARSVSLSLCRVSKRAPLFTSSVQPCLKPMGTMKATCWQVGMVICMY